MRHIASRDNPHFKALRKLCQSGRERRKTGLVLLDGMHLIEAYAAHCGWPAEIVVSESGTRREEIAAFLARGADGENPPPGTRTLLADALFAELAAVDTPSGIMAVAAQPKPARAPDMKADAVLLDGVQDPGNVGSILRSAAAAGVRQVLLAGDCAHAWSPKTLRAAMGAHFLLDIHENADLGTFLDGYGGQGAVTALDAATSLYAADLRRPVAWVFGSEGQGVRPEVAAVARLRVRIPMPGATESLNVAAAAAVCLFETLRQRL
ncbi:MAG: RNA methyltransferase [Candidatus Accumulibacter sp.]|nr:RNA methyltransferase [Accumulibacter sp.]MBA4093772.1 RNA methyltransferase [Accumulibacter sp.]